MTQEFERGTAPLRIEYIQEDTVGEVPDPADWKPVSDNIISAWSWQPDANTQRQDAAGEIEAQGFFNGAETHEVEFEYDLQQWFYDGSGNTQDPLGDFLKPSSDNALRATHSWLTQVTYDSGGNLGQGYRTYTVGKGGHPDSATIPFETEDGGPITVTASYQFEKVRRYTIHRYSGDETLTITNNGSSDVDIVLEEDETGSIGPITVSANSSADTNNPVSDLTGATLLSEVDGSVVITVKSSGGQIMEIKGSDAYPADEGDLGVPVVGAGSRGGSVGGDYLSFLDDELSVTPGNIPANISDAGFEVVSGELNVSTGLSDNTVAGTTARRNIYPEEFEQVFTLSLAGEHLHVDQAINYLTEQEGELTWTTDQSRTIVGSVRITSPGEYTKEAGTAKLVADNEFEAIGGITVSNA